MLKRQKVESGGEKQNVKEKIWQTKNIIKVSLYGIEPMRS